MAMVQHTCTVHLSGKKATGEREQKDSETYSIINYYLVHIFLWCIYHVLEKKKDCVVLLAI